MTDVIEWIAASCGGPSTAELKAKVDAWMAGWYAMTGIPADPTERELVESKVSIPSFFSIYKPYVSHLPSALVVPGGWVFTKSIPTGHGFSAPEISPWSNLDGIVITYVDGRKLIAYRYALPSDPYEFARLVTALARSPSVAAISNVKHTSDEASAQVVTSPSDLYAIVGSAYGTHVPPTVATPTVLSGATTGSVQPASSLSVGRLALILGGVAVVGFLVWRAVK